MTSDSLAISAKPVVGTLQRKVPRSTVPAHLRALGVSTRLVSDYFSHVLPPLSEHEPRLREGT